jgi:hypothetical protein
LSGVETAVYPMAETGKRIAKKRSPIEAKFDMRGT